VLFVGSGQNVSGSPHNGGMNSDLSSTLGYRARLQYGVFSRKQALQAGFTSDLIRGRVRRGSWQCVYPGVYTLGTAGLPRMTRLWAVLLYAGRGAVLSYQTAAELHKLTDKQTAEIHVSIPGERRVVPVPGVRFHRSAQVFRAASAHDDPPRTNVDETVLDLAGAAATIDEACGWIMTAISRELTDESRLRAAMAGRTRLRWRAELDQLITAAVNGDHSVLEYRFTRDVERAHGLPEPDRQVRFGGRDGRRGRRDRVYSDYGLVVELDGKVGHQAADVWRDKDRDNAAAEAGKESLRYGWRHVRHDSCVTAIQVAKVLRKRGWDGQPRPCSIYCPVRHEFPC